MGLTSRMWSRNSTYYVPEGTYTTFVDVVGKGILESLSFIFRTDVSKFSIKIEIDNNTIYSGNLKKLISCFNNINLETSSNTTVNFDNIPIFVKNNATDMIWNKINKPFKSRLKISLKCDDDASGNELDYGQISYFLEV